MADGRGWPPADPVDPNCILKASRVTPPDGQVLQESLLKNEMDARAELDTFRIQTALNSCPMVKLTTDGANNAFLASHLVLDGGTPATTTVTGKILWIDAGVTLFMSRNSDLFQKTGNCGALGVNDSSACFEFIDVQGEKPGDHRRRDHRRPGRRAAGRQGLLVVAVVVRAARDRRQHRQPDDDQPREGDEAASCSIASPCTTPPSSTSS